MEIQHYINVHGQEVRVRDRIAAGIIAILGGSFGIHKFYLGRTGWGIIYILFSWTFLPGVIGIVEGIIYLLMTDREFDIKYNK